jgi:lipopolysaccharide/colanic/teichoic acid biosynthesis glycosyltransferase
MQADIQNQVDLTVPLVINSTTVGQHESDAETLILNDYLEFGGIDHMRDCLASTSPGSPRIYIGGTISRTHFNNQFFEKLWDEASIQQEYCFSSVTAETIKLQIRSRYSSLIFRIYYPFYFFFMRVCPKLKGLRKFCRKFGIVGDMSKSEMMGRLMHMGFCIIHVVEDEDSTTFVVKKDPQHGGKPSRASSSEGFLFSMQRVGQHNKPIQIYKFRSMHPYSEFVQAYLHRFNGLDEGGKFKDDFRVSTGGKFLRKYWLDEIPMIYNLLKGDIKLVGVRPISQHYFSLYPEDLRELRTKFKPGLLPPFYADLPVGFQAILESEKRYLEAYAIAPFKTDCRYLFKIFKNIFVNRARSK